MNNSATIHLSTNFTLQEAQISETAERMAIDNSIPSHLIPVLEKTATGMERVRAALNNRPISVNSWYRSLLLNRALNSKDTSQHRTGQAVDFICPAYGSPVDIVKRLVDMNVNIRYDQIILEHSWVHISFTDTSRGQVLSLLANGSYSTGITDRQGNLL